MKDEEGKSRGDSREVGTRRKRQEKGGEEKEREMEKRVLPRFATVPCC
jgi:hypothetical protein